MELERITVPGQPGAKPKTKKQTKKQTKKTHSLDLISTNCWGQWYMPVFLATQGETNKVVALVDLHIK
jgi:hypothetical protein